MIYAFLLLVASTAQAFAQDLPSCDSKVFCQGDLLHTVQMSQQYDDSKTFVDKKMRSSEEQTLTNFESFMALNNDNPTKDQILEFINNNFEDGNELEDWTPLDFNPSPEILSRIEDPKIRNFTQDLVNIWPKLAKKVKEEVFENQQLYTLLPVHNGFIIPGGRFKEFYYWDSYWIVQGLLICDMHETVRGMLENFLSIVDQYGFLPNGARIYYLNRSQPPLLSLMVARYIQATNNTAWLQENIHILDKELRFWLDNKLVTVTKDGTNYTLARYGTESGSPRPESYYQDYTTASSVPEADRKRLWSDLKGGAESGWDFSSRWIIDEEGGTNSNLSSLHTSRIIPVDLNAFLCQAFRKLAEFYIVLNDYENATFWFEKTNTWQKTIERVLYNSDDGIWYDWDNELSQPRKSFWPSNFAPLWAEAYDPMYAEDIGGRAAEYLENEGILDFYGGIPTSLSDTREQWDYPNAWPPLQSIVILGLDQTGNCQAKNVSRILAERWVSANMIGFNQTQEMFEKYDCNVPGQYGGGGEYTVQSGFGWTNGVVFEFIERYFTSTRKSV